LKFRTILNPVALVSIATAAAATVAFAADPQTEEQKTMYAIGIAISRPLSSLSVTEAELDMIKQGMTDSALNRPLKVDINTYGPKIEQLAQGRSAAAAEKEKKAGAAFLAKAAAEPGVRKTPSGALIKDIKVGTGPQPKASDTVKVHYHGTLPDGTVFDSSVQRGSPATFPLTGVIKCWTEGVQEIKVGGKARLVCPSDIAYGDRGSPPKIKPGATLVFEVELLEIVKQ
jgi:FKBP-type peptidyl-prolyl cis-trans isomerase FkpA